MGTSEQMMRVNVEGTRVLVQAALQAGCERFLYMSTMAVYAFEDHPVVDESTPFLHDGPPFQLSRVRAEEAVWTASTRGLPVTVLRPPNILGAHPTSVWSVLLVQRMINGNFVFSGDGSASVPHAHVDNLVDAVLAAANTPRAAGEAYNIVDGQTTGLAYTDRFRHWLRLEPFATRPEITPWRGRYSGAKAERELGYVAGVSYEEAMSETERYLIQCGMIKR
jgi:nucleoside-diphosphate-sugar epimerase